MRCFCKQASAQLGHEAGPRQHACGSQGGEGGEQIAIVGGR